MRLPCFTRSSSIALSTSPSASVSAFLQSIIPAPVRSRSALTSFAEISGTGGFLFGRCRLLSRRGSLGLRLGRRRRLGGRVGRFRRNLGGRGLRCRGLLG